ncbi:hypothetical protein [Desulfosoma caldarium]|nr:hypothetical protein [Desulfosoma caldarium]
MIGGREQVFDPIAFTSSFESREEAKRDLQAREIHITMPRKDTTWGFS